MALFGISKEKNKKLDAARSLEELRVCDIIPNPNQPRKTFDDESIEELARSIKQVGLIQPLVVRRTDGGYELVAGERRLRAVRLLGLEKVTCIIENTLGCEDSALMAVIENLQREDLNYFEEAECYQALLSTLGTTQEELANRLGKSQSFIANKLRMLKFSPQVREALTAAELSERHARAIIKLRDNSEQLEIIEKVRQGSLSVKETERLVEKRLDRLFDTKQEGARPRPVIMRIVKDYRLFVNTVNEACTRLRESGMSVDVSQEDREDGVDITIRVTQSE